jgi:hypothetical protein|tara:strand:- start:5973 stop:6143 length:171 start_codon:yes stop_codon:yes gene_type:complete
MDAFLHLLGLCGDTHSHFDLIDLIIILGGGGAGLVTIKLYYRTVIYMVKNYIKKII